MENIIVYIILGVVALAVFAVAVRIISALLPYLLGGAAVLAALAILGVVISGGGHPHYKGAHSTTTAQQSVPSRESSPQNTPSYRERNEEQARYHAEAIDLVFTKDDNVNLSTLQPAMDSAIVIIDAAFNRVVGPFYVPTVTSGDDYEGHCYGSAHYSGAALDYRLKDIDDQDLREMVTVAVREALGDRYFVDHEAPGEENEHLHVQLRRGTYEKVSWR